MNKKRIGFDVPWLNLSQAWAFARKWLLPNPGTLVLMVILALAVPAIASPTLVPSTTSTSIISYQGRLADSDGTPLTGKYDLEFRIYNVPTDGVPLWTELWTEADAMDISDGLFSVMLGSIDNTLAESIEGYDELYLGITVNNDNEMVPRVQLGSVPFSFQAQKALTTSDGLMPPGTIVMWSGPIADIPDGWALCDGTNSTPDLRDRFVLSVGTGENPGGTGGSHTKTLSVSNLPAHIHSFTTDSAGEHAHQIPLAQHADTGTEKRTVTGGSYGSTEPTHSAGAHTHSGTTNATGSGSSFDVRPKYYELAFIMKQ